MGDVWCDAGVAEAEMGIGRSGEDAAEAMHHVEPRYQHARAAEGAEGLRDLDGVKEVAPGRQDEDRLGACRGDIVGKLVAVAGVVGVDAGAIDQHGLVLAGLVDELAELAGILDAVRA